MRYYDLGNGFYVCYNTITSFQCEKHETHQAKGGYWNRGDIVREKIKESVKQIDKITTEITVIYRNTKLNRNTNANCPNCGSKIRYLGWRVFVEDNRKEKTVLGMFSTGTKYPYSKYCKTLKNRKATIDRLINKYS